MDNFKYKWFIIFLVLPKSITMKKMIFYGSMFYEKLMHFWYVFACLCELHQIIHYTSKIFTFTSNSFRSNDLRCVYLTRRKYAQWLFSQFIWFVSLRYLKKIGFVIFESIYVIEISNKTLQKHNKIIQD